MNHARGPGRLRPFPDRPLPHLIGPRGEKPNQLQRGPHCRDNFGQNTVRTDILALLRGLLVAHHGEAFLQGNGDGDDGVAGGVGLDPFGDFGEVFVFLADVVLFGEVDEVDDRFCGEEEEGVYDFDLWVEEEKVLVSLGAQEG